MDETIEVCKAEVLCVLQALQVLKSRGLPVCGIALCAATASCPYKRWDALQVPNLGASTLEPPA